MIFFLTKFLFDKNSDTGGNNFVNYFFANKIMRDAFSVEKKKKVYYYSYFFFVIYTFINSSDSTVRIIPYPSKSSVYSGVRRVALKPFFVFGLLQEPFAFYSSRLYQYVFFSLILRTRTIIFDSFFAADGYTSFSRRKVF